MRRSVLTLAVSAGLLAAGAAGAAPTIPAIGASAYPGVIRLAVDATDTERRIMHATETIPVKSGPLVLFYPQWLPGTHSPSGRLDQMAGLECAAGEDAGNDASRIAWTRDAVNVWAFHFDIPRGTTTMTCRFDFLSPLDQQQGREVMTPAIVGLQWNQVLLYPAGHDASRITFRPTLTLPPGFGFGTALRATNGTTTADGPVTFGDVDLETLVDSPLFSSRWFKAIDLDPGAVAAGRPPIRLNLVADREANLDAKPDQIDAHKRLVEQADRLFASRHYAHYDFLLALSDQFSGIGLEHHQSSENGVRPNYFTDWKASIGSRTLLPHEYTHSWDGKFRRPADLSTPNFNVPMQDSLLWVYEGQTQYWGNVLAARSGLQDIEYARELQAATAASYDVRAGRTWRNLQDTTNAPIVGGRQQSDWVDWVRGADYYDEMNLIWLDVDTKIRELSKDTKSLDDFARTFFGVDNGRVKVSTYTFEDVVAALDRVQHYDWRTLLRERLDDHGPGAPLDGFARSGWKLVFTDKDNQFLKAGEGARRGVSFRFSLGFDVSSDPRNGAGNRITNVGWKSPAFDAGLTSRMTLVAINGRSFTNELLREAIVANTDGRHPMELIVKAGDYYRTVKIDYRGGLRYPHLVRIEGTPDRLTQILSPKG